MSCPFPEHHSSGGGSGLGPAVLAVLVAIVAAAAITPVVHVLGVLIHVLGVVLTVVIVAGGGIALLMLRRHLRRQQAAGGPLWTGLPGRRRRHARALPDPQQGGMHIHLHGVTPDVLRHMLHQGDPDTTWRIENTGTHRDNRDR